MGKIKDLTGQRFGMLTVLEYDTEQKKWRCVCDCGNEKLVERNLLVNCIAKSCGCASSRSVVDISGQRFGMLTVVEYDAEVKKWRCRCDCGNEKLISTSSLAGGVKSCGCLSTAKDLAGQRFGKLVAVEPMDKRKGTSVVWRCLCDCGKETLVRTGSLVSGNTKSCGCLYMKDLAGQKFGKLTAVEPTDNRKGTSVVWRCRCDCGNEKLVSSSVLVRGKSKSCGCLHKKDLAGQRLGRLTAIEPIEERQSGAVVWRCRCDCGNEKLVSRASLVSGNTKSCGCLRRKTLNPDEIVFE